MTKKDIVNIRLHNQRIAGEKFLSPGEVVGWMGAMQAQDFPMAKWAVGLRTKESTEHAVESAVDKGEILRTHVLRPTWHFVAADDIYWMLELSAPQIRTSLTSRQKSLELTGPLLTEYYKLLERMFKVQDDLTRNEIADGFKKAKIKTGDNRLSHILLSAELEGLISSGKTANKNYTYALLSRRVPERKTLCREEALSKLALTYFTSHGPATLEDFVWWSGLGIRDARNAIEYVRSMLNVAKVNSSEHLFAGEPAISETDSSGIYLLPAYDEFIISYKDRSAVYNPRLHPNAISNNGIFRPVIIYEGKIAGLWKRTQDENCVTVSAGLFDSNSRISRRKIKIASEKIGSFLDKESEVIISRN